MKHAWSRLVLLSLLLAAPLVAQKGPNVALGFQPDKMYDFSGIDSVNLFNGNLTVTVPLAQYQVGPTLQYGFTLVYNGKAWDFETYDCENPIDVMTRCEDQLPNLRSSAGLGWRLSLGRLLPPTDVSGIHSSLEHSNWIYEGPSGDEHDLGHSPPGTINFSHDPAALRMKKIDETTRDVELPNGVAQRFKFENEAWRLKQISDPFGNAVWITYAYNGLRETSWSIQDSLNRTHTVTFEYMASMADGWSRGSQVKELTLAAHDNKTRKVSLEYDGRLLIRVGDEPDPTDPPTAPTPPPAYGFTYHADGSAALQTLTLPTGGAISYEYQSYYLAEDDACQNGSFGGVFSGDVNDRGVRKRIVSDGATSHTWEYVQRRGPQVPVQYSNNLPCRDGNYTFPPTYGPWYWSRTSVLHPAALDGTRTRTDHYFNIFGMANSQGWEALHPFSAQMEASPGGGVVGRPPESRAAGSVLEVPEETANYPADVSGVDAGAPARYLSSQVYERCASDGNCTTGRLVRATFQRYTSVSPMMGQLVDSTRTYFMDDTGCGSACYAQTDWTLPNGVGQFKNRIESSNFPGAKPRSTQTGLLDWSESDRQNPLKAWITGIASSETVTEGDTTLKREMDVSAATGAVNAVRTLRGTARGAADLLTVYGRDSMGNVRQEKSYGGDSAALSTSSCCTAPSTGLEYLTRHSYQWGFLSRTEALDPASCNDAEQAGCQVTLKALDYSRDRATGLVTTSRDSADVETTYSYDRWGRLSSVSSPATAPMAYSYANPSTQAGAYVTETTTAASGTLVSMFEYDGLGQLKRLSSPLPNGGGVAAVQNDYDAEGRKIRVSQPVQATSHAFADIGTSWTQFRYDAFGREASVTVPDGSTTTFAWTGTRRRTRHARIQTPTGETSVSTSEEYDPFGRLVLVREPAGATTAGAAVGADVTTTYTYDAGNRLSSVLMKSLTQAQARTFTHDGRGFLVWESHPESGMSAYTYDARGHVRSVNRGNAGTVFDLEYTYDPAERIKTVSSRNPSYIPGDASQPQFRPLKTYSYGSDNGSNPRDLRQGKILTASRYNYPAAGLTNEPIILVTERYAYGDDAGRNTHRTTEIQRAFALVGPWDPIKTVTMETQYNDLGLPSSLKYPECVGCAWVPRTISPTYSAGRLATVPGFVDLPTTYWPNGMRRELKHSNGIVDTQNIDTATLMGRPTSLTSAVYDSCTPPVFVQQPAGGRVGQGGSKLLSAFVTGTATVQYQWWRRPASGSTNIKIQGATQETYNATPSESTYYWVVASNACRPVDGDGFGGVLSDEVLVSVDADCVPLSVSTLPVRARAGNQWDLEVSVSGSDPTITWRNAATGAQVGTGRRVTVGPLATTTTFTATVTQACSGATEVRSVIVEIPLPITTNLQANVSGNAIDVQWPASAGATQYRLERRSGPTWSLVGILTTTSYRDSDVTQGRTYAYRVAALDSAGTSDSGYSNADIATIMSFTPIASNQVVSAGAFDEMLGAVNKVRGAVGWPLVSWGDIISPSQPLPQPGVMILAAHIASCRARMNEALQALGAKVLAHTPADLRGELVRAAHVQQVQGQVY